MVVLTAPVFGFSHLCVYVYTLALRNASLSDLCVVNSDIYSGC